MEATARQIPMAMQESYWRDRAVQYMEVNSLSQKAFASMLGFNNSSGLNQYLKGTYKAPASFEKKLQEFFNVAEAAAQLHSISDYVKTSISEAVYTTIRSAHLKGQLAIECGDAGIGKTKAAQKYVQDYPNSAYLVTVNPVFANASSFLKLLCRTLHIAEGRRDDMWLNAASFFSGSRKVLIVDEAQHLPIKTIELIRQLADYVATMAVVFIGNRRVVDNMGGRREAEFAQLENRTRFTEIRHTRDIKLSDIQKLFPALVGDMEQALMLKIAQGRQGLRGAVNLYSEACDNENITYEGLLAMAKAMRISI
jgi:DNA transposition AAA+ family ATPase